MKIYNLNFDFALINIIYYWQNIIAHRKYSKIEFL